MNSSPPCSRNKTATTPQVDADWIAANYDANSDVPNVDDELRRLRALKSYHFLLDNRDSPECYDRLTELACRLFRTSMAFVSLVDMGRLWTVSAHGVARDTPREIPRKIAINSHTILARDNILVCQDLSQEWRFAQSPTAHLGARFFVGVPLFSPNGCKIGTLSVADHQPRNTWTESDSALLKTLAASVMDLMEEQAKRIQAQEIADRLIEDAQHSAKVAKDTITHVVQKDPLLQKTLSEEQLQSLKTTLNGAMSVFKCFERTPSMHATKGGSMLEMSRNDNDKSNSSHGGTKRARIDNNKEHGNDRVSQMLQQRRASKEKEKLLMPKPAAPLPGEGPVDVISFVLSLKIALSSFPKTPYTSFAVDPSVPRCVVFHEVTIFRCALALLWRGYEMSDRGIVHMRIFVAAAGAPTTTAESEINTLKELVFEATSVLGGKQQQQPESSSSSTLAPAAAVPSDDTTTTTTEITTAATTAEEESSTSLPDDGSNSGLSSTSCIQWDPTSGKIVKQCAARRRKVNPSASGGDDDDENDVGATAVAGYMQSTSGGKYKFGTAHPGTHLATAEGLTGSKSWFSIPLVEMVRQHHQHHQQKQSQPYQQQEASTLGRSKSVPAFKRARR